MFSIEMLPALNGDCLWITYGSQAHPHHVLIDGGYPATSELLRARFAADPKLRLDLMILTHIDEDHIYGAIDLLAHDEITRDTVDDVWFNGWRHLVDVKDDDDELGAKQGEYFSALIEKKRLPWNQAFGGGPVFVHPDDAQWKPVELPGGMKLTLLSPTAGKLRTLRTKWKAELKKAGIQPGNLKQAFDALLEDSRYDTDELGGINVNRLAAAKFSEDTAAPNGSSIAVLAEYGDQRMILTGDAHPSVIGEALERLGHTKDAPLEIDVLKLSHHGSKANNSPTLLERLRYRHVLVSTNGDKFHHPDAEALARVVHGREGVTLHFNYVTEYTKPWLDKGAQATWKYHAKHGSDGAYTLEL